MEVLLYLVPERETYIAHVPVGHVVPEVHCHDLRKRQPVIAVTEPEISVVSPLGFISRSQIRSGAAEDEGNSLLIADILSDLPRAVSGVVLGPVGVVILLIYYHEAEICYGRKNCAPGSDNDPGKPRFYLLPLRASLGRAQTRVQNGDIVSEIP